MVGDIFEANDLVVVTTLGINELYIENKKYDNKCFNLISSILYQFKDYLNVDPKRMIIIMCLVITITIIIRLLQLFKLLNKNSKLSFIYRLLSSYANMSSIGGIYLLFKETFNSSKSLDVFLNLKFIKLVSKDKIDNKRNTFIEKYIEELTRLFNDDKEKLELFMNEKLEILNKVLTDEYIVLTKNEDLINNSVKLALSHFNEITSNNVVENNNSNAVIFFTFGILISVLCAYLYSIDVLNFSIFSSTSSIPSKISEISEMNENILKMDKKILSINEKISEINEKLFILEGKDNDIINKVTENKILADNRISYVDSQAERAFYRHLENFKETDQYIMQNKLDIDKSKEVIIRHNHLIKECKAEISKLNISVFGRRDR
uniref:Uncharacterized protein n=1 Tax=Acrasis kona TaxID=1008807 RepID=A0A0B4MZQ3_9EUKA|nr:hypothetical protein [Acrasis kona]AID52043.1 hypothetical protein [Acrasis kona]